MNHTTQAKLASLGIFIAIAISITCSIIGFRDEELWASILRVAAVPAALALLSIAIRRRARISFSKPDNSNVTDSQKEFSSTYIKRLRQLAATRSLSAEQARLFAMSIVMPSTIRERVVETFEANSRTLHQKVKVDLRVNSSSYTKWKPPTGKQYLPLLIPEKGELLDGFRVYDSDGSPIRTLPYREHLSLTAAVLHTLVVAARDESTKATDSEVLVLEQQLMELIARPSSNITDRDLENSVAWLKELVAESADKDLAKLVAGLVEMLITHYVVVVCVDLPPDGLLTLGYERIVIPSHVKDGKELSGTRVKRAFQLILGARPMFVSVPLSNAWTCESYHLQVQGPEGLYLSHQAIDSGHEQTDRNEKHAAYRKEEEGGELKARKYYTFRRRLGQSYGHFYARSYPALASGNGGQPQVRFTFYETPPGSDFQATVAAISAFLLLWLIGFVISNSPLDSDVLGSDAPVLLLAFPGVAASWVGFETRPGLLSRSLSAVVSLMSTAILSIIGSALFMLHHGEVSVGLLRRRVPGGLLVLGVDNAWWAVLITLSMINAVLIGYRCIIRSRLYDRLVSRPPFGLETVQSWGE